MQQQESAPFFYQKEIPKMSNCVQVLERCQKGVSRVSEGRMKGVYSVSGRNLESVPKVSQRCLGVSEGCLKGVRKVNGRFYKVGDDV